jgi:hypothetical protein
MIGETEIPRGEQSMKTFLLLATSSVITAGMLPSIPAKIILSTFVLMTALVVATHRAPVGYQDEGGFHRVRIRRTTGWRAARKLSRQKLFVSWLVSDSRRPAKA